jgi:hypothetical protein
MREGNVGIVLTCITGKTIIVDPQAVVGHLVHPGDDIGRGNGGINVEGVATGLHVQVGLRIEKYLCNGLHFVGELKLFEDVAVLEETDVQVVEKFVEGTDFG